MVMGKSYNHANRELGNKFRKKLEKLQEVTSVPNVHLNDDEVERLSFDYSIRAPGDYVVSGPITGIGGGPGRVFATADSAEEWARGYFGNRFRKRITDSERGGRWSILVAKAG